MLSPNNGTLRWKKPAKARQRVFLTHIIPAGALTFSSGEINLLDVGSGRFAWKKPIRTSPQLTAAEDGAIFAFDDRARVLKRIDTATGKVSELGDKIRFAGSEEPERLQIMAEGILLTSAQNMALVSREGETRYQRHFPAPRRPAWLRALYYAHGIRAAILSAQSYYVTAGLIGTSLTPEYGELSQATKSIVAGIGTAYGEQAQMARGVAAEAFRRANARFKATRATANSQIMMVRDGKKIALQFVDKRDGRVVSEVDLGDDKTPNYVVDPLTDRVFLQDGQAIVSYVK